MMNKTILLILTGAIMELILTLLKMPPYFQVFPMIFFGWAIFQLAFNTRIHIQVNPKLPPKVQKEIEKILKQAKNEIKKQAKNEENNEKKQKGGKNDN